VDWYGMGAVWISGWALLQKATAYSLTNSSKILVDWLS